MQNERLHMKRLNTDIHPVFKKCPNCGYEWKNREQFLNDADIEIIGYQVNFTRLLAGYFMFNHICKGTFTVPAEQFKELYNGPIFSKRATGKDECNQYCLAKDELRSCPVQCECAYVREIISIIKNWPKELDSYIFSSAGNR
jgi:hypothetical protein